MTGCRASVRWVTKTRVGLTNHAMTKLTFGNMELVGPPRFPNEARDFARQIQSNLGLEPMENPFLDDNERLMPPAEYETRLRRAVPEWQTHYTSDDYVDYTWHAPTVRLLTIAATRFGSGLSLTVSHVAASDGSWIFYTDTAARDDLRI